MIILKYRMVKTKSDVGAVITECYCKRPGTIKYYVGDSSGKGSLYEVRFCSGLHRQIWISYGNRGDVFSKQKLQLENIPDLQKQIAEIKKMYEEDSLARMEPHYPPHK